jgi:hypothetical protein
VQFPVLAQTNNLPAAKEPTVASPVGTPAPLNPYRSWEEEEFFQGDLSKSKFYDINKVARTKVSIDVQDGNLFQILEAIRKSANQPIALTAVPGTYESLQLRVFLKVRDIPLGDALRMVAAMGSTGFYVLPDKFVIGPYFLLTPQERKQILPQYYEASEVPTKEALIKEGVIADGKK